jgi:hypothetical protein
MEVAARHMEAVAAVGGTQAEEDLPDTVVQEEEGLAVPTRPGAGLPRARRTEAGDFPGRTGAAGCRGPEADLVVAYCRGFVEGLRVLRMGPGSFAVGMEPGSCCDASAVADLGAQRGS